MNRENRLYVINMPGFDAYLSRKPIKNINVRIDRQGNVNVSAPMNCSLDYIQQFLQKKKTWIMRHQTSIHQHALNTIPLVQSGDLCSFLGQPYVLMLHEHAKRCCVALEGNQICCYVTSTASTHIKQTLFTNWQRQQMQALLPTMIQKWEEIIGIQANYWSIRAMKTRWGTCNTTQKRICLNLYLIQYPLSCLEYVLVHELVHLLEASHNQRFYALMSQFMPDWKEQRRLLKYSAV